MYRGHASDPSREAGLRRSRGIPSYIFERMGPREIELSEPDGQGQCRPRAPRRWRPHVQSTPMIPDCGLCARAETQQNLWNFVLMRSGAACEAVEPGNTHITGHDRSDRNARATASVPLHGSRTRPCWAGCRPAWRNTPAVSMAGARRWSTCARLQSPAGRAPGLPLTQSLHEPPLGAAFVLEQGRFPRPGEEREAVDPLKRLFKGCSSIG